MGGLAIQIPENLPKSEKFLPLGGSGLWFVTSEGITDLLAFEEIVQKEFPDLSYEDIKSKSKANGFAKTLVCFQASWFIAQCLTRRKCYVTHCENVIGRPSIDLCCVFSYTAYPYQLVRT